MNKWKRRYMKKVEQIARIHDFYDRADKHVDPRTGQVSWWVVDGVKMDGTPATKPTICMIGRKNIELRPVASWSFDPSVTDTVKDETGNSNDLTPVDANDAEKHSRYENGFYNCAKCGSICRYQYHSRGNYKTQLCHQCFDQSHKAFIECDACEKLSHMDYMLNDVCPACEAYDTGPNEDDNDNDNDMTPVETNDCELETMDANDAEALRRWTSE